MQKLRLSIVLALCMLLAFSAFATETETVTTGVTITAAGATVANGVADVVITVNSDVEFAAVRFSVNAPEGVTLEEWESSVGEATVDDTTATTNEGWNIVTGTGTALPMNFAFINFTEDAKIENATLTLTFAVADTYTEDTAAVTVTAIEAIKFDESAVAVSATDATITVKTCDHTNTEITYTYDDATHTGVCACGETVVENEAHTLNPVENSAVEPSFTAAGKEADQACVCGYTVEGEEIPMLVAKAYIGETPYESVQDAVDAVAELDVAGELLTITLVGDQTVEIDPKGEAFYLQGNLEGITLATTDSVLRVTTVDDYVDADEKNLVGIVHSTSESETSISMAVTFETLAAITMKMRIPVAKTEGYDAFYAKMSIAGENPRSYWIHDYELGTSGSTAVYDFYLPMLAAKQMNDTITCTFYGVKDDGTVEYRTRETSFVAYTNNVWDDGTTTQDKLLAAMLNYGTAAQVHFGYETSTPANALLDTLTGGAVLKKDGSAAFDVVSTQVYGETAAEGVTNVQTAQAVGLYLEDEIRIKLTLALANAAVANGKDDLTLVANYTGYDDKIVKDTIVIPGTQWTALSDAPANVAADSQMTVMYITGIAAKNMRSEVTYEVYRNYGTDEQEQITNFRHIGIEHYITNMLSKSTSTESLKAVCKAILAYADAAAAHFN